jgi:hypothetical protein
MEEIYLEGPLGNTDIRIINSYPSKVEHACAKSPQKSANVRAKSPKQAKGLLGSRRHREARRSSGNLCRRVSE